jgi:glycosyltransferase involved in cell wall biosynthesis
VAHIISGLELGGAEITLYRLLSRVDRGRLEPIVVSMTDRGALGDRIEELGVEVYSLGMRRGFPAPWHIPVLMRLLRRLKPEVVQTWMYHADLLGVVAAKLAGIRPVIWNVRGSGRPAHVFGVPTAALVRACAAISRWPDAVVVNSARGRDEHKAIGYRPRRWELIPNGVDVERFRPDDQARKRVRAELGALPETLLVGSIGRDHPMKDRPTLLRAFALASNEVEGLHLVLAGDGMTAGNEALRAETVRLGIADRVSFLGIQTDMPGLLNALDALVLSSSAGEGFPNVVAEAMACGVLCAVTDVGDAASIVGESGRVVPSESPDELAAALAHLLTAQRSERLRLSAAARQRAQLHFSMDAMVGAYASLYEDLAAVAPGDDR